MDNYFFESLFGQFSQLKVAVIGDVMMDTYWWGNVDRISPEAPVPVVSLQKRENRLGGAANVALNLRALGAQVQMLSVIGTDDTGSLLLELFEQNEIDTRGILRSRDRITTVKSRIISRHQQMLRLDAEIITDLNKSEEADFLRLVKRILEKNQPDVLIFEDYNKGVLTENVIAKVIGICTKKGIPTCVDPKQKNFLAYQHVTIFKPNLKEVKEGLHIAIPVIDKEAMQAVHEQLHEVLHHQISFITLSEKGVFVQNGKDALLIPSHLRNIADVSGAGDTVIAVASLVWAATQNAPLMAEMANIAGGLVCEEVGVVAINKEKLLQECIHLLA